MLEQKQKSILFANYFLWGCKTGGFCYNDSMYTYKQTEGAGRSPHIGAWKRKGIVLLALVLLLSGVLPGCSGSRGDGTVVCLQFVQLLAMKDFEGAYALIDPEIQNNTGEKTPSGTNKVSLAEFKEKYTSIFDAMGLTDVAYNVVSTAGGTITASADYDMTYYTELAGNLTYRFTITSEYRDGWYVQWSPALIFPTMEWGDKMLSGINYPRRGEIFDCNGNLLASNINCVTVYCLPSRIQLAGDNKAVTDVKTLFKANDEDLTSAQLEEKSWYLPFEQQLASIPELGLTEADVRNAFARTYQDFCKIATLYPDELTDELEAKLTAIEGIGVDTKNYGTVRSYPYGKSLCHLLGYAGVIQKEYLYEYDDKTGEKNEEWLNDPFYDGDSWLGYAGLEKHYENILRGEKGSFAYIQGARGSAKQVLYNIPAKNGQDLHLSIDINLQQRTEQVINNIVYTDDYTGAVLVMNPKTGAVQAMVSFPGYDPNAFSRGDLTDDDWSAMSKDPQEPLFNRIIQGLYPPGSTFKPLTAITTLESGTMTTEDAFPEDEEHLRGDDVIWNPSKSPTMAYTGVTKVTRTYSTNRRGPMNMKNCMIQSDNIYFAYCAMKIGWDTFKKYLTVMGMGESIPFDLPTQKSQIKNESSDESYDLLAMTGYGQGELLLTPLQLAAYIGAFHNQGQTCRPYVIESTWQQENTEYNLVSQHETEVWKTICAPSTAATINDMLEGVVALPRSMGRGYDGFGTGRFLGVRRTYLCAGKTGTAELDKAQNAKEANKEIAWFVAYRSAKLDGTELKDSEERLVLVMLEVDMTKQVSEWTQMKFQIAQALLKDDTLTEEPVTEDIMTAGITLGNVGA